jgi:hypothetical protein
MTNVDVFGKTLRKSTPVFKILSNGGLSSINDSLMVKVDLNSKNILSLSANGLMANGIKSTGGVMTGNLSMIGNKIIDLDDPINSGDATTKNYVDNRKVKSTCGLIPNLCGNNSKQGFTITASSECNLNHQGWTVFSNTNNEWASGESVSEYLQIQLPFPVAVWAFSLKGRLSGTERWYNWTFEGSNDIEKWDILYFAHDDYLGNKTKFYTLATGSAKYLYFRFYGVYGEPTNPGLSYMQIYSIDDLLL